MTEQEPTAPDAPGTVTIPLEVAHCASSAFSHAPWSDVALVQAEVKAAEQQLHAAIDAAIEAAERGTVGAGEDGGEKDER